MCEERYRPDLFVLDDDGRRCVASPYMVLPLPLRSVHGERLAVQTRRQLEGLDELGCSDATGALRHDTREAHLSLHFDLKLWNES